MRSYQSYPDIHGTVHALACGDEELARICTELSLTMSPDVLKKIRNHYINFERRLPSTDELIMLDIIYSSAEKRKHFFISSLETNDKTLSDTFSDAAEKYSAIFGEIKAPISLDRLFRTAQRYLDGCDIGVRNEYSIQKGFPFDICNCYVSDGSETSFAFTEPKKHAKRSDAVYLYLQRNENTRNFLLEANREKGVFLITPIEKSIFLTVLDDCEHAELFLSDGTLSLRMLPSYGKGDFIIKCGKKAAEALTSLAERYGLKLNTVAAERKNGRFCFHIGQGMITIDGVFLSSLARWHTCEEHHCILDLDKTPRSPNIHMTSGCDATMFYTDDISFSSGEQLILSAVAVAIASGKCDSIRDSYISLSLRLPSNVDVCDLLSLVLGLYRAETELCIKTHCDELIISDDVISPMISAAVIGSQNVQSSDICGAKYLISVKKSDDRSEYYAWLRRLYDYIVKLRNSGHISELSMVGGDTFFVKADCVPCETDGVEIKKA